MNDTYHEHRVAAYRETKTSPLVVLSTDTVLDGAAQKEYHIAPSRTNYIRLSKNEQGVEVLEYQTKEQGGDKSLPIEDLHFVEVKYYKRYA